MRRTIGRWAEEHDAIQAIWEWLDAGLHKLQDPYAGSVSSNPTFIILGLLIIIGWRVAGWWGLDRFLLTWIGTPWEPGRLRPTSAAAHKPSQR